MYGCAFFNECQTFLLSGILAGKIAFNAIAKKIFNPELACHLSKKGSHGRKIQLDGTMVLELLYNTTAKRDPTCGNEAHSLDSWLRHTFERFEAWPQKAKDFPRIQVLSEARQLKVRAFLKKAATRAAQRKKERDEENEDTQQTQLAQSAESVVVLQKGKTDDYMNTSLKPPWDEELKCYEDGVQL